MLFGFSSAALLYVLAQPPVGLWPLAWICLVPWLAVVGGPSQGARSGIAFGLLVGVGCGWWSLPVLVSLGASPVRAGFVAMLAALWAKGLSFGVLGIVIGAAAPLSAPLRISIIATALAMLEILPSLLPLGAPWALLGHSQAPATGIAQLAAVGGVPLVSLSIALVNGLIADALLDSTGLTRRVIPAVAASVVSLALLGEPALVATRKDAAAVAWTTRVLAVQPAIPPEERWLGDVARTHLRIALHLAERELEKQSEPVDVVVFPEMLLTTIFDRDPALAAALAEFAVHAGVWVVIGAARPPPSHLPLRYRNSVLVVGPDGAFAEGIDKVRAVPAIEGIPRGPLRLLASLLGDAASGPKVEPARSAGALQVGPHRFAAVLCYELLFPRLVASRRDSASVAILQMANDSWLNTTGATEQQLAAGVFRAIETRLPVVRVSMNGRSAVIDRFGRIRSPLRHNTEGSFVASVQASSPPGSFEAAALFAVIALGGACGALPMLLYSRRTRIMKRRFACLIGLIALSLPSVADAESAVATLRLDGLSYVSFEGKETYALPEGGQIRFQFDKVSGDSVSFRIQPSDVAIPAIRLPDGSELHYGLASSTSGSLRRGTDGQLVMSFPATIVATRTGPEGAGTTSYGLQFTTETARAASADGTRAVEIQGMRLVEAARYVQLVGAVTNRAAAYPAPGAAVSAVLSGTFDELLPIPTR